MFVRWHSDLCWRTSLSFIFLFFFKKDMGSSGSKMLSQVRPACHAVSNLKSHFNDQNKRMMSSVGKNFQPSEEHLSLYDQTPLCSSIVPPRCQRFTESQPSLVQNVLKNLGTTPHNYPDRRMFDWRGLLQAHSMLHPNQNKCMMSSQEQNKQPPQEQASSKGMLDTGSAEDEAEDDENPLMRFARIICNDEGVQKLIRTLQNILLFCDCTNRIFKVVKALYFLVRRISTETTLPIMIGVGLPLFIFGCMIILHRIYSKNATTKNSKCKADLKNNKSCNAFPSKEV